MLRGVQNNLLRARRNRSQFSANNGILVNSEQEAVDAVRWYAAREYWSIKSYNSMNPAWIPALVKEAHRLGLKVQGHVPAFATADQMMEAGFDGYAVDFRRSTRTYYMPDGEAIELETERTKVRVDERFDAIVIKKAILEAQALVPDYTYKGFCEKVMEAGCAGYLVSLVGQRALYYGRTGETHTEYFPGTKP